MFKQLGTEAVLQNAVASVSIMGMALMAQSCAAPPKRVTIDLPLPPRLERPELPAPPAAPQPQVASLEDVLPKQPTSEIVSPSALPPLRNRLLWIARFDVPRVAGGGLEDLVSGLPGLMGVIGAGLASKVGGMLGGLGGGGGKGEKGEGDMSDFQRWGIQYIEMTLPPRVLSYGLSRVLLPDAMKGLYIEREEERSGPGGSREKRTLVHSIDKTVFIDKVRDADYMLYADFLVLQRGPRTFELPYVFAEGALGDYEFAYAAYKSKVDSAVKKLQADSAPWDARYRSAHSKYEGQLTRKVGGCLGFGAQLEVDEASTKTWEGLKSEYQAYLDNVRRTIHSLKNSVADLTTPEDVKKLEGQTTSITADVTEVDLLAKLFDVKSGAIIWTQRLRYMHPSPHAAIDAVMNEMLATLSGRARPARRGTGRTGAMGVGAQRSRGRKRQPRQEPEEKQPQPAERKPLRPF